MAYVLTWSYQLQEIHGILLHLVLALKRDVLQHTMYCKKRIHRLTCHWCNHHQDLFIIDYQYLFIIYKHILMMITPVVSPQNITTFWLISNYLYGAFVKLSIGSLGIVGLSRDSFIHMCNNIATNQKHFNFMITKSNNMIIRTTYCNYACVTNLGLSRAFYRTDTLLSFALTFESRFLFLWRHL